MQTPDAWPNTFRQARFISAVDMVQADRMRRAVAQEMERVAVAGGPASCAFAAGRDAHHQQFHRTPVAHASRGLRASFRSTERLGSGSKQAAAEVRSAAPRAARCHAHRSPVRRGDDRSCGIGARALRWMSSTNGQRVFRDRFERPLAPDRASSNATSRTYQPRSAQVAVLVQ